MTDAGKFVAFAQSLKGDEKQESQTFLNHFFQVFGYEDVFTAGHITIYRKETDFYKCASVTLPYTEIYYIVSDAGI